MPDRFRALLELRRVLKPGARLAISEEFPDPAYVSARTCASGPRTPASTSMAKTGSFFCYSMVFSNRKENDIPD